MLHTICYISSSCDELSQEKLNELYNQVKRNNFNLNVSGILIHEDNTFFQILEGESHEVKNLYKKITTDIRHKHVLKIINTNIEERIFEDYQTGFEIINNQDKKANLESYLDWLKNAEIKSIDKMVKIAENFIARSL